MPQRIVASVLRFLLVNPTAPAWRVAPGATPRRRTQIFRYSMLSSLSVAAALPPGVEARIVDEEVEAVDFDADADLLGISFMTFNAPRAYEIADRFRNVKGIPVIVGGYHPTFMPEEAKGHADAVCIGEAETSLPAMIDDFRRGVLKPFYEGGHADLRALRIPDRSLLRRSRYSVVDAVQATRGCAHGCTFCSITSFFDRRFRPRPVADVVAEIVPLRRWLLFMDDNITCDPAFAKELFARMIPLHKRWYSQASVTIAEDDELLRLAAKSGCRGLFIGFESLSQEGLAGWQKNINAAKDYRRVVERIHQYGIGVCAAVVLGGDSDTPDVFDQTLAFLDEAKIDALQATILTPFPGTPLFREMDTGGRIVDRDWSHYDFRHVVFEPARMSRATLKAGHDRVLQRFYSLPSVARRITRAFGYLDPSTVFRAVAGLNIGYRDRLSKDGTLTPSRNGARTTEQAE